MAKVTLVSLGCPKNLVDSECALGNLRSAGHEITVDQDAVDVIVVNTCGFIESAREEATEAISEALEAKSEGRTRKVIVVGCLAQRYGRDIFEEASEIDAVIGIEHFSCLAEVVKQVLAGERVLKVPETGNEWVEPKARVISTSPWTAYLKVSEGCDNRCSYCAVPDIRGPFRSRPMEYVIEEAERLAACGVKELILIGQDLTRYGDDIGNSDGAPELLRALEKVEGVRWIRLMYCYPTRVTDLMINVIRDSEKIVKYIDLPLQHGDDTVLKAMNRKGNSKQYLKLIDKLRKEVPGIAIRSTFIVGFPGETDEAFDNLTRFMEAAKLDRLGAFIYSPEEGTPAASLKKRVLKKTATARYDKVMLLQQEVSLEINRGLLGQDIEVLVEGHTEDGAIGRSYRDAPEIDGVVYLPGCKAAAGEFVGAKVISAEEYDLTAECEL